MSKKILLIESDAATARTLSSALEARGFEARVTGDGKEGLELAKADRPDVIVLCVELPKMSGYAVCNKLKKDDELKGIPLVITSAEATPETFEAHKKLKARAEEYLIKPFDAAALLEKIATLIEMPPAPEVDEIVTLDDVEEIDPIEAEPEPVPGGVEPASEMVGGIGAEADAGARRDEYDEDLRLLDEAFENIAGPADESAAAFHEPEGQEAGAPFADSPGAALSDIDRLGAEADAALAALQAEPTDEQFAAVAVALGEPGPAVMGPVAVMEPPVEEVLSALPHDDGADVASILDAKGRVAQLTLELTRAREGIQLRDAELAELRPRAQSLNVDLEAQTARARRLEEQAQRANEEVARLTEAAKRDEDALRAAQDEIRVVEERLKEAEALAASEQDRADREEKERLGSQTAARAATERAEAAERDAAELRRRLEEAGEASTLKTTEADQARERAEELAREVESLRSRVAAQEGELAALQPQLDASRQALSDLRGQGDAATAEARRRISELEAVVADLEAQNAKHEERIVKAYQKIKGDEKMREKTRKALAIALQLLEDRPAHAAVNDDQPRRE
jgi:CheY-like chemotaxis protein